MSFTMVAKGNATKIQTATLNEAINKFIELRNLEEVDITIDEFNGNIAEIRSRFGRNESLGVIVPSPEWEQGIRWIGGDGRLLFDEDSKRSDYEMVFPYFKNDDPNRYYGKSLAECEGVEIKLATYGQKGNTQDSLITYYVA